MNDAEFDRLSEEYKQAHMEWAWRLGLQWWDFSFAFYRGPIPNYGMGHVATTESMWEYQSATVRVNIVTWEGQDATNRSDTVVHELVHCILAQLRPPDGQSREQRALEEHAVTTLSRALLGRMRPPWNKGEELEPQ